MKNEEEILEEMTQVQRSFDQVEQAIENGAPQKEAPFLETPETEAPTAPKPAVDQGILGESYKPEEAPILEAVADETDHGEGISVQYSFTGEEARTALKIFQRYTIWKKYLIYILILAVLCAIYLYNIVFQSGNQVSSYIAVVCVAVICFLIYLPHSHIKNTVKAIEANPYSEDYTMTVYADGLKMGYGETANFVAYGTKHFRCWETPDLFIIGQDKQRVFIVPKRCCSEQAEAIGARMKEGFGDSYLFVKPKK